MPYCELTEGQKVNLFIKGLNSLYRTQVKLFEPKDLEDARRRAKLVADATGIQPSVAPVHASVPNLQTFQTTMQENLVQPFKEAIDNLNAKFEGLLRETQRSNTRQTRRFDRSRAPPRGSRQSNQDGNQHFYRPQPQNRPSGNETRCPHCNGKARYCSFKDNQKCPGQNATCYDCNEVGHLSYVH